MDVAAVHVELLSEYGHLLRMPHSRPLGNGLFELRLNMGRQAWRITYWYRPDGVMCFSPCSASNGTTSEWRCAGRSPLSTAVASFTNRNNLSHERNHHAFCRS